MSRTPPSPAEEMRALIAEGNGVRKDLERERKLVAELKASLIKDADELISRTVKEGLDILGKDIDLAREKATTHVFESFDRLAAILIHGKDGRLAPNTEAARDMPRLFLEALGACTARERKMIAMQCATLLAQDRVELGPADG